MGDKNLFEKPMTIFQQNVNDIIKDNPVNDLVKDLNNNTTLSELFL